MTGELLPLDDALAAVLVRARPLPAEDVALERAAGRVLAADAAAAVDVPPFATSAMDGFAVRAADTPGTLAVTGQVAAGAPAGRELAPGEAMGIATGGAVPGGADAVVPVEYVVANDNEVEIPERVEPGRHIRPAGGDVRRDEVVVPRGSRLTPARMGALAAAGVASLSCARRPRVAVLPTGSELRAPGQRLGPGEIYEANAPMLVAALERAGASVERLPVVADDEEAHRAAIRRGLAADVLVTSGGVSVGPHDLVRRVERELRVEELLWGVAVKPGKPLSFGVHGDTLVFGLPGNPVSSLVGLELFVLPAVRALQGDASPEPALLPGVLGSVVRRNALRDELVRATARVDGNAVVLEPLGGQDSHMIVRSARADALALIPRGDGELAAGSPVRYLPLA